MMIEIKSIIRTFPKKKMSGLVGFIAEFDQTFKKELMPILLKLFKTTEWEDILSNSFYEAMRPAES